MTISEKTYGNSIGSFNLYAVDPSTRVCKPLAFVDNEDGTVTLKVDTELTATIDPTGLALASKQDEQIVLLSGTGKLKDNGPGWPVTRTYTTSADMTTAAAISPAAGTGMKLIADDILVSSAVAMEFSIQQETEATVFASVFIPANGTVQITLRDGLKTNTAVRKFFGKASVAGNVRVTCCIHEEA